MIADIELVILLPNPPPVYSLITTTSSGLLMFGPNQRAIAGTVCEVLWVPV